MMQQMFVRVQPSALLRDVKWCFFLFVDTIWLLYFTCYLEHQFERRFPTIIFLKIQRTKCTTVVPVFRGLS